MEGRTENENKIKNRINSKVEDMPDYMSEFYYHLSASKKTSHTIDDYINKVNLFLKRHNYDLSSVTRSSTMKYFISIQTKENGKSTSDSYQRTVWFALNSFFEYMVKIGELKENYMNCIDVPKDCDLERINKKRILLTENDFSAILKAVDKTPSRNGFKQRDYLIMALLMTTGMRETALISINLEDINIKEKTLYVVDKGKRDFVYSLQPGVIEILDEWLTRRAERAKCDALFINPQGNRLSAHGVYDIVKKYSGMVFSKSISPHKIRSGYCSILYKDTKDIEYVRKAVGHRRITTTQRYIVTDNNEMKNASGIIAGKIGL